MANGKKELSACHFCQHRKSHSFFELLVFPFDVGLLSLQADEKGKLGGRTHPSVTNRTGVHRPVVGCSSPPSVDGVPPSEL